MAIAILLIETGVSRILPFGDGILITGCSDVGSLVGAGVDAVNALPNGDEEASVSSVFLYKISYLVHIYPQ